MDFKDRLRQLRMDRGLTQQDLAKQLHYGFTAISNYENGRNEPSIANIIQLAEIFGVTIDYLLCAPTTGETPTEPSQLETMFYKLSHKSQRHFLALLALYLEKEDEQKQERKAALTKKRTASRIASIDPGAKYSDSPVQE